jgi:hypothetical protein
MTQAAGGSSAETASRTAEVLKQTPNTGGVSVATGSQTLESQQGEEARTGLLERSTAGSNSAAGQERDRLTFGEDIPEGADRGSKVAIVGGAPKADFPAHTSPKPTGNQAKPALMSLNGTVAVGLSPSPTGPFPAERARALGIEPHVLRDAPKGQFGISLDTNTALTEEQIRALDRNTLRAVAHDRGYDIPLRGVSAVRSLFLQKQKADPRFKESTSSIGAAEPKTDDAETGSETPPAPPSPPPAA